MIRPLGEYILVQCEPDAAVTEGGLALPERFISRARHQGDGVLTIGRVLAVGPGDRILKGPRRGQWKPVAYEPGLRILFPRHQLCPDLGDGQTLIHQQHVLCAVDETAQLPAVIKHQPSERREARGYTQHADEMETAHV